MILLIAPSMCLAQSISDPFTYKPKATSSKPNQTEVKSNQARSGEILQNRTGQIWRLPNGYEEYYMLLALNTNDKKWCDRISLESQIRKVDARPGVQVIRWRDICLIETARATGNRDYCRFVRGEYVDSLDGREFNPDYCLARIGKNYSRAALHWLQQDPRKTKFMNAQSILKFMGFVEQDLVSTQQQGLYQYVFKSTWEEFLLNTMFTEQRELPEFSEKFDRLVDRSQFLPDFSANPQAVDRYLRYAGTTVKMPPDCYENPSAELTCRMLECLNVRDIVSCRAISNSKEIQDLQNLFLKKCDGDEIGKNKLTPEDCRNQVGLLFQKIFTGPPETFLPYLPNVQ